jgi:phage-related protein
VLTLNILEKKKTSEGLCTSCVYEVNQKGFKGERLTFCSYGGGLRELKFEVCECTVYGKVTEPVPRTEIGFVRRGETARPRVTVIKIS